MTGPRYDDVEEPDSDSRPISLAPDVDEPGDAARYIDKHYRMFFEEWLEYWCTDPTLWPKRLTRGMFQEWFDVRVFELVFDTIELPLQVDE